MIQTPHITHILKNMDKHWVAARSHILGNNGITSGFDHGITLARACSHPEAKLVVQWCDTGDYYKAACEYAADTQNPSKYRGMALFFAKYTRGVVSYHNSLVDASALGYPLAQAVHANELYFQALSGGGNVTPALEMLEFAASQDEPFALYRVRTVFGASDDDDTRSCMRKAAKLGWLNAQDIMQAGSEFPESLYWACKSVKLVYRASYVKFVHTTLWRYDHLPVMFKAFKTCSYLILDGDVHDSESNIALLTEYAAKYHSSLILAREACVAWVLCAKRMAGGARHPLCKDVRIKIARILWRSRKEGLYLIDQKTGTWI